MFNTTPADLPSQDTLTGSSEMLARAKRSKGVTIKRTIKSRVQVAKGPVIIYQLGGLSNFRGGHEKNSLPNGGVKISFMNP